MEQHKLGTAGHTRFAVKDVEPLYLDGSGPHCGVYDGGYVVH